ncbi:MAG: segregation/condensation protein A [Chthoniobacterales bacterium]|nr:segregation/condensation protein A [Chthoniobacterales bacterium]
MDPAYQVKLDVFEGPLDLLLYLVKRDEVDIYDIEIGRITRQYLEYLEAMESIDVEIGGEFIVMAANLLLIKSRTLLPVDLQGPAEEEGEDEDPRWELIRQLIEYKKFKEAAGELRNREELAVKLFGRSPTAPPADGGATLLAGEVGALDLIAAFQRVLARIEKAKGATREIEADRFTVSEKIEFVLKVLPESEPLRFEELFAGQHTRGEVVATFLALLELVRLRHVRVEQVGPFGDILLRRRGGGPAPA